jgi:glyoxylase-like metal-dependent hydrolase (beta-lactamase superfamily II)
MNCMSTTLEHGISCIDTGYMRPGLAACYLVCRGDEAAIIETGTSLSVERILLAMRSRGISPSQIRYVIPTHVHLDHAGGAGALLPHLPNATVIVHPRGARHLIDPTRLIAGAEQVYGKARLAELYGEIAPIPEARIKAAENGSTWALGDSTLLMRDAPGHARHHFCVWDERSGGWFSGDAFGVAYPELSRGADICILPTTTPVQFEPEPMVQTIRLLMSYQPRSIYLTHFGRIRVSARVADSLIRQIDDYLRVAKLHDDESAMRAALSDLAVAEARNCGCAWPEPVLRDFLDLDVNLNAQGLMIWKRG